MSHQTILTKAIKKALKSGWEPFFHNTWHKYRWEVLDTLGAAIAPDNECRIYVTPDGTRDIVLDPIDIIYDHDFAKALWGEQGFPGEFTGKYPNPQLESNLIPGGAQRGWKYHLQQMVVADDPIAYLADHL